MAGDCMPSFLDNDISQDVITLLVGDTKDTVVLHRDMLCAVSKYFEKALKGNFIEAGSNTYNIPDFQLRTVKRFQDWLYRGTLGYGDNPGPEDGRGCGNGHDPCISIPKAEQNLGFRALTQEEDSEMENLIVNYEADPLIYLYVLADRYDIPLLRMDTIEKLWRRALNGNSVWWSSVIYAWGISPRHRHSYDFC